MIYAPVLIPTLNRYQHFKECIESLSRCTWANKTDVYVAVDYPPNKKYWDGYNEIKDFLDNCGNLGFKSLHIKYRETNYFFTIGNIEALIDEVLKSYDRFILSEDDNVFSPNFLVYMNKGLEKFEADPSVLAINGYRHFYPVIFGDNTFFRQNVDFSAWGYGMWKNRYLERINNITPQYYRGMLSVRHLYNVVNNGNNRAINFLELCRETKPRRDDNALSVLMAIENMDVIMPRKSLVRNMGWDNSGEHCSSENTELAQKHSNQEISDDVDFEFVGSGFEYYNDNKKIYVKHSYGRRGWLSLIKNVGIFMFRNIFLIHGN